MKEESEKGTGMVRGPSRTTALPSFAELAARRRRKEPEPAPPPAEPWPPREYAWDPASPEAPCPAILDSRTHSPTGG